MGAGLGGNLWDWGGGSAGGGGAWRGVGDWLGEEEELGGGAAGVQVFLGAGGVGGGVGGV